MMGPYPQSRKKQRAARSLTALVKASSIFWTMVPAGCILCR